MGSEGSDLSGYVIGADLQPPPQQPQPGGGAGDDNNVVVVQLECPRCQRIDSRCACGLLGLFFLLSVVCNLAISSSCPSFYIPPTNTRTRRVVPAPDDADTGAAATAAAAAAAAAAYAVGAGGGLGHSTSSGAFGPLPPASAAAAVERSGSTGSLSLLLDASGGRSGSGRLSRMPSFRLPSFSLLSGSANGSSNSLSAASGALLPAVLPRGPPVPSASALQLQHLLGVELTAEEHKERELAVAVAAAAAAAAASADAMESLGASVCVSSSSATSSEAASSEDGEASDSSRACTPRVLLLGEEGEKEAKAFVEEEEEEDPHLGLAREVVLELRRGEKTYRPPASFDAATVMVPQPGARQQQQHQQSQQAQPGGGGLPLLMRAVIVDWVLDIHARLKLGPQSLYLAVLILDRYALRAWLSSNMDRIDRRSSLDWTDKLHLATDSRRKCRWTGPSCSCWRWPPSWWRASTRT